MRVTHYMIWIAWVIIAGFFVFALAASSAIPFSNTPVSFATVVRSVSFSSFVSQFLRPWHAIALAFSAVPVVVHTWTRSHRIRVWIPVLCLALLLLWFIAPPLVMAFAHSEITSFLPSMLLKSFAQWFIAIPVAPVFTFGAVAGRHDGEFYEEGMLAYAGMGWWMLLCLVLLVRAWVEKRRATKEA